MYPPALRPLLANPAFAPADITAAWKLCDQWFRNTASLASFVLRAIFVQLVELEWDHQAVPLTDWQNFVDDVLPRMIAALDAVPTAAPGEPVAELSALVVGFHSTF